MTTSPVPRGRARVVLIDDHTMFLQGLRSLLEHDERVTIVGTGSSSDDAERLVTQLVPDFLLLDVEIPGRPALSTVRKLVRTNSSTRIIIVTVYRDRALQRQLLHAGAHAFVTKSAGISSLLRAMFALASSDARQTEAISESDPQLLTARESEILRLVSQARSNREIADALSIAEGTVKRHTSNVYTKLGTRSRVDAIQRAVRLGLLDS